MTRTGAWTVVGGVLLAPVLALAAWVALTAAGDPSAGGEVVDPVVVPVSTADVTPSVQVGLTVETTPGRQVLSQAAGTLTDVVPIGTVLTSGSTAFVVDDRPVVAMVADAPMWRDLRAGDNGADVARLQTFLGSLGYGVGAVDGSFGPALGAAVRAFHADHGHDGRDATFALADVAWIGPDQLTVAQVLVDRGGTVAPGSPVLAARDVASSVVVDEPDGVALADYDAGAVLRVDGVEVPYVVGTGLVDDPASVGALAQVLGNTGQGAAQVSAATARTVLVVPATALVTGGDGTTCLYPSATGAPVVVVPVGGGNSSVQVPIDTPLTAVLANPAAIALAQPCGS